MTWLQCLLVAKGVVETIALQPGLSDKDLNPLGDAF
jgi:hypothetical protein